MRISIAMVGAVLAAACGGGGSGGGVTGPPPSGIGPAEVTPEALPPGSSGFPGLDWGDSIEAIQARYPAAELRGDELELTTRHGGHPATVSLMLTGGSLIAISVSFTGDFDSMPTCSETFHKVRAELDRSIGDSGEENLAAFWSSETASMTLWCEQEEGAPATLSMSYSLAEEEL